MDLQGIGAIGELIGGVGVILSLIYVAYQIRQSSQQIEINSRHMQAAMYHQTGDAFSRWWALLAQNEHLAAIWARGLAGEELSRSERLRFYFLANMIFIAWENSWYQWKLGSVERDTLAITREGMRRVLESPAGARWWERLAPQTLTPEFRAAVERELRSPRADAA